MSTTPFAAGLAAYQAGKKPKDNPYTHYSILWTRWMNGYQEGISVAQKAADKAQREAVINRELPDWAKDVVTG